MRKLILMFFILTIMSGVTPGTAYATDCAKDTVIDKFGDWFGNLGKKESVKKRNIAARRTNRLARCAEAEAKAGAKGSAS